MKNKIPWINLLQGTDSDHDYSTGNSLPLVARPWGMHHWSLQTGKAPWTFKARDKKLHGIRLTHQPSPWMRDYASAMLCPFHGDYYDDPGHQASAYQQNKTVLQPNLLKVHLVRYGIDIEMSPVKRGAIFRFTGKTGEPLKLRFDFDGKHALDWTGGSPRLHGMTADCFEGEILENFGLHLSGLFSVVPESFQVTASGGYFVFPVDAGIVEMRLAGSFISSEMADLALMRELENRSLDDVKMEGGEEWESLLGRIDITSDSSVQLRTFYSCLYRCLLFPRFLDEENQSGQIVHYSPFDGQVHEGSLCCDSGFWDTYRTLYPLLALIYPDVLTRIMQGWVNACRQAGWTPKWPSPGSRDCMIGTHFDVVAADMIAKGLTDWDVEGTFDYLWKDATVPGTCGRFGRRGLEEYIRHGYVPNETMHYSVSSTLDYAYDDFCVSQVARYLGKNREADLLLERSGNFRNVFDSQTGFMRARSAEGQWLEPFGEFRWGGPYIEGGPWQHRFNVPHDVDGLVSLLGGRGNLCRELDKMLESPPSFESGSYPFEIHEMTEMAVAGFGQYAQSNQPVHAFLFLYALAGEPEKTGLWVKKVLAELYSPDFFPGDEDNGEMSAWYIWGTLGLFPFCPGKPEYVSFSPSSDRIKIRPGDHSPVIVLQKGDVRLEPGRLVRHQDLVGR